MLDCPLACEQEPIEVFARGAAQARDELRAAGAKRVAEMLGSAIDPLAPSIILNQGERTWLNNAWWATLTDRGERQVALASLALDLAAENDLPELRKHPNSGDYRKAFAALALVIGREAGRRGLEDNETAQLLQEVLRALRTDD